VSARLFVALDLPDQARLLLAGWTAAVVAGRDALRAVASENLHVTLAFIGHRDEAEVEKIGSLVTACAAPVGGLSVAGGQWLPARRPRLVAVDLEDAAGAADSVQREVVSALADGAGFEPEKRPFWPHVTVARVRGGRGRPAPAAFSLPPTPELSFAATALTLYRSRLGRAGARYEPVARAELSAE
jgi:2'-5' RNA ligase